jgi:FkbM family methyltransferase
MKNKLLELLGLFKKRLSIKISDNIVLKFDTKRKISKQWYYPRYILGKPHEPSITNLFVEKIKQSDVVLDIGANQGYFTVLAAKLIDKGSVHAFEMDPVLLPCINDSLKLNKGICKIYVNQAAVYETSGELLTFAPHKKNNLTTNSLLYRNYQNIQLITQTISLDEYCEKMDIVPNFIKIDVEGAELSALKGMKNILEKYQPSLLIEIHPKQLGQVNQTGKDIINYILTHAPNYSSFLIDNYRKEQGLSLNKFYNLEKIFKDKPEVFYFELNK